MSQLTLFKQVAKTVHEGALELVYPTRCVSCNAAHQLLCPDCYHKIKLTDYTTACHNCGAPFGYLTCTECQKEPWETDEVICAATYQDPVDHMIKIYKDGGERRLAYLLAALMFTAYTYKQMYNPERINAVTYIPATQHAYSKRGFDHMQLIAQHFSQMAELPLTATLTKLPTQDQRHLTKQQRAQNVSHSFEVRAPVEGQTLLLLDDAITTGATLNQAAQTLKGKGAHRVIALALARVW